jgi:hypothetical protein
MFLPPSWRDGIDVTLIIRGQEKVNDRIGLTRRRTLIGSTLFRETFVVDVAFPVSGTIAII